MREGAFRRRHKVGRWGQSGGVLADCKQKVTGRCWRLTPWCATRDRLRQKRIFLNEDGGEVVFAPVGAADTNAAGGDLKSPRRACLPAVSARC